MTDKTDGYTPNVPQYCFQGFEETAAYVPAENCSRSRAITEARAECEYVFEDYHRADLHARKVWLRYIEGEEAEEFFYGDYETGYAECEKKNGEFWMWKVEPKS